MDKINMAILGAGSIAGVMAKTISAMPEINAYAVAARNPERAASFALQYGFEKSYGNYEEMLQDERVQLVYIATPHALHFEHAMLCIRHGKPVLCEKPLTANATQAKTLLAAAKENNVFITEALWTRFMPITKTLVETLRSGIIGEPVMMQSSLGYNLLHVDRMTNASLAGGALLDLGIYPLTLTALAFGGEIEGVTSKASLWQTGVDAFNSIDIRFKSKRIANVQSSMVCSLNDGGVIYGEDGCIVVDSTTNIRALHILSSEGEESKVIERPGQITGYEYEVRAAKTAIEEGRLECDEIPHVETVRMLELMDGIRADWGVAFPFEQ